MPPVNGPSIVVDIYGQDVHGTIDSEDNSQGDVSSLSTSRVNGKCVNAIRGLEGVLCVFEEIWWSCHKHKFLEPHQTSRTFRTASVIMDRVSPRPFYRTFLGRLTSIAKCLCLELANDVHGGVHLQ